MQTQGYRKPVINMTNELAQTVKRLFVSEASRKQIAKQCAAAGWVTIPLENFNSVGLQLCLEARNFLRETYEQWDREMHARKHHTGAMRFKTPSELTQA